MPSPASWAPLRFQDKTLDRFVPTTEATRNALRAARAFAAGTIGGLVLAGPTGTGKTHLAVAAAEGRFNREYVAWEAAHPRRPYETWNDTASREALAPKYPAWGSVPELIVGLRSDMDREMEDRSWAARMAKLSDHRGVLVLDDLGREKVSDWTGEAIYVLVNGRYERRLPTIVTTNLTGAELAASPYWPVISRLAEDGELVKVDGGDHRLGRKERAA